MATIEDVFYGRLYTNAGDLYSVYRTDAGHRIVGLLGAIFVAGLSDSWIAVGLVAGAWINWLFVAGRLRVHTEFNNDALTLPDYFTHRFEDNSRVLRIISAAIILLFFTLYCASGVIVAARLFESTFGLPYDVALWVGAASTVLYVFIGGFLAVSWTDTVQATLMIFTLGGAVAVGFFGIAYFTQHLDLAVAVDGNSERVFMELAKLLFNPWIAEIILAGVLAAVMSTLSCQLLISSSAITEGFYKGLLRKNASQKELVWVGRLMVLLIALLAIYLASDQNTKVLDLVSCAWAGFGAAFGPVVLLSVTWRGMTRNGALAGMLVGALTVVLWKQYSGIDLYEIIPSFVFASVAIYLVSMLGKGPSAAMLARFAEADQAFHSESY
jgi:Na+/proline symporter